MIGPARQEDGRIAASIAAAPLAQGPARRSDALPYNVFLVIYVSFATLFYFREVSPYLATADLYAPRLLADAIAYGAICVTEGNFLDWYSLRDIGPCTGLRLFNYNNGLLSLFNAAAMSGGIYWLSRAYNRSFLALLTLLMLNPITFFSLFGPNKEVFGVTSIMMLAIFVRERSLAALGLCLVTALFTRVATFVVIAAFCAMMLAALPRHKLLSAAGRHRYHLIIIAILATISVVAVMFGDELQYLLLGDLATAEELSQSTTISLGFDPLVDYGLYLVAYLGRMALNLYSAMASLSLDIFNNKGLYYNVGVVGSSVSFAIITFAIIRNRVPPDLKSNSNGWNLITFMALFTLVLCISPVIQHRYFYPLYVILLLFVVQPRPETVPATR